MNKANGFLAVRIALALGLVLAFILWVMAQYPPPVDSDGDGLTDDEEAQIGSDPYNWDTDYDSISDYDEVRVYGTAWWTWDTDGDNVSDYDELFYWHTDPLDPLSTPHNIDSDGDGLSDYEEAWYGTDPFSADHDGDGLGDWFELAFGTNPWHPDSDGDGLSDLIESVIDFDQAYYGMGFGPWTSYVFLGTGYSYGIDSCPSLLTAMDAYVWGFYDLQELLQMASSLTRTDPWNPDSDGDGLADGDEIYLYNTNPAYADTDFDGVDDKTEIDHGYDPCYPDVPDPGIDSNGDGVCDWHHLLAGENPYAPPADPFMGNTAQDIEAWSLTPSINIPSLSASLYGMTVYSKTITVNKTGPWQLFYVAGYPYGSGSFELRGHVTIEVDGVLYYDGDSDGSWDVSRLPFGNKTNASVTVTLSVPSAQWMSSGGIQFSSVYLLRWSPDVSFSAVSAPIAETVAEDGIRYIVAPLNDDGGAVLDYWLDISTRPHEYGYPGDGWGQPLSEAERAELNAPPASLTSGFHLLSPMDENGYGTVTATAATLATIKVPSANHPTRIAFIKPEITRSGSGISPKPLGALPGHWPLDSASLRNRWKDTFAAAGASRGNITVTTGLEAYTNLPPGLLNISIGGVPGNTLALPVPSVQPAGGGGFQTLSVTDDPCDCVECEPDETKICIASGGTVLWSKCVDDDDDDDDGDDDDDDDCHSRGDCDCHYYGDCDDCDYYREHDPELYALLCSGGDGGDGCGCDDDETGMDSVKFRVSLGNTENGTPAGFVWLALDAPQPLTPGLFRVLAAPGVTVATNGSAVTATAPERTAVIAPADGGVRIAVSFTGSSAPHSLWTFTNPGPGAIRAVRTGGAEDSDETFAFDGFAGVWSRTDNLRNVTETLVAETSPDGRSKTETRTVTDNATGALLSLTSETREPTGAGPDAATRITASATLRGSSSFLYWEDPGNPRRDGKLKLRTGDTAAWQYHTVDDLGRSVLTAGPLDGSPPGDIGALEPSTPEELAALGVDCIATVRSRTPDIAAGDSGHSADAGKVRETAVYAVRSGTTTAVSRICRLYTRGTDAETGYPTLTVLTTRYPDPSSLIICHSSSIISYAGSEAGVDLPAALWNLPLLEVSADGVTNTHAYAFGDYDPGTLSFTENPDGPCLRTVSTTSASPLAELTVADAARGNVYLKETYYVSPVTSYLLSWEISEYDDRNRPLATFYSDGTSSSNDYGECGCRPAASVDRDGSATEYWTDPANPLWSATAVPAAAPGTYAVTETFKDGIGRVTRSVRCVWNGRFPGGARDPAHAPLETRTEYPDTWDPGHSVVTSPTGRTTDRWSDTVSTSTGEWGPDSGDDFYDTYTHAVSTRGGGSSVERWWNGKYRQETRVPAYGPGGLRTETVSARSFEDQSGTPPVIVTNSVTVSDALGRVLSVSVPAFGGGRLVTSNFYDGATSRLIRQTRTGQPDTLYRQTTGSADGPVREEVTALDINGNGTIDLSGPDRVTASRETYEEDDSGVWWHVTASITYPETGSPVPFTNALTRIRLTGLGIPPPVTCDMLPVTSLLTAQSETFTSAASAPLRETTFTDAASATVWTVTETPGRALPALRKTVAGRLMTTVSSSGVTNLFTYDATGNRTAATDGRGNTAVYHYNAFGQMDYAEDASGSRTSYARDSKGRVTSVTDPLTNTVHTAYDGMDNITAQWGATYPVAYRYDTAGRKTALYTYRGTGPASTQSEIENLKSEMDCTRWLYDPATGLCTNKVHADGSRVSYSHTPDGRPLRTTWARGAWKENAYDPATGDLAGVTYSDGTPPVTYARDRIGRVSSVTDASGTAAFTRRPDGSVLSESTQPQDEAFTLHESRDPATGLSSGYALTRSNTVTGASSPITDVAYEHDPSGRLSVCSVGNIPAPFRYDWLPGSDLVQSLAMPNGVTRETEYEPHRDLPASVTHTNPSGTVLTHRAFTRDALARVTSRTRQRSGDPAPRADTFTHNARSELISAVIGADIFGYAHDGIGNRELASENAATNRYAANALNQYTLGYAVTSGPALPGGWPVVLDTAGGATDAYALFPSGGRTLLSDLQCSFNWTHEAARDLWLYTGAWAGGAGSAPDGLTPDQYRALMGFSPDLSSPLHNWTLAEAAQHGGFATCGEDSFSQYLWDWLEYRGAALHGYDGSWDDWWSGSWLWSNYAFAVHDTGYTGPWGRWRDNGGYEEWIEYRIAVYGDGCAGTWDDWMADTGLVYPDPAAPAAFPYDEMTAWVTQARQAAVHVDFPPVIFTVNSAPRHDADGNQTIVRTSTGVWHVSYNADNRPVCYSNDTAVVTLGYDYLGRCFRRAVSEWSPASSEFQVSSFQRYLYRGYLRIAALDLLNDAAVIHTVVWDPAEPVATCPLLLHTPSGWYTYGFDQAKTVTELFDSAGSISATYDYSPFGENMAASGPAAALNPFRFSSEVWDAPLGLVDYTFRPYNPLDGRFLNRDPIGEQGGLNLYGFVGNDPVNRRDRLGLNVENKINIIGGLDWEQFKSERAAWGGGANDIGLAIGITMSADYKCNACPENKNCRILTIIKDTYVLGRVFWARDYELEGEYRQSGKKAGYDIKRHELRHAEHTLTQADYFDNILHRLAKGSCISSACCSRQHLYLNAAIRYYQKVANYYDAQMDDEDYGKNNSNTLDKIEAIRQEMEDAMRVMVEREREMNEKCN
jgi:RHS repeat-associated protein